MYEVDRSEQSKKKIKYENEMNEKKEWNTTNSTTNNKYKMTSGSWIKQQ